MKADNNKILTRLSLPFILRGIGILLGIGGGYLYYIKVGCNSGSCPITSNPWMSMLWGGLVGYLIADMIPKRPQKQT